MFEIKRSHPNIVIAGDFNCRDINWNAEPPTTVNPASAPLMNRLLDFISEYALHQHVTDLTRPALMKNLDLVLSSSPTLGSDVTISPGMSDHDIVNFAINTNSRRVTKPLHKVYLYDRMDIDGLRNHTAKIRDQFMSTSPD